MKYTTSNAKTICYNKPSTWLWKRHEVKEEKKPVTGTG